MRECNANCVFLIRLIRFTFDGAFDVYFFDLIKLSVSRLILCLLKNFNEPWYFIGRTWNFNISYGQNVFHINMFHFGTIWTSFRYSCNSKTLLLQNKCDPWGLYKFRSCLYLQKILHTGWITTFSHNLAHNFIRSITIRRNESWYLNFLCQFNSFFLENDDCLL